MQRCPSNANSRQFSSSLPTRTKMERYVSEAPAEAFLITCTDPVLDTSLIAHFRSEPVLVWRNMGPVVPPYGTGQQNLENTIDQAVMELGIKEIAICGHLPAAPLRALIENETPADLPADDPCLYYVRATRRIVEEKYGKLKPADMLQAMVEENVFVQMANLRTYPAVLAGLARGNLKLHSWIYDAEHDELYGHSPTESQLLARIKRFSRPTQRILPCLDPCDIYLA